jgi:small subunit ribosomal protein S16
MSVKIRLRRMGATKRPSYRVVVADSHAPRGGAFVETIGNYDPLTEPATLNVKEDRIHYWLEHGAEPTEAVMRILKQAHLSEKFPQLKNFEKEHAKPEKGAEKGTEETEE